MLQSYFVEKWRAWKTKIFSQEIADNSKLIADKRKYNRNDSISR